MDPQIIPIAYVKYVIFYVFVLSLLSKKFENEITTDELLLPDEEWEGLGWVGWNGGRGKKNQWHSAISGQSAIRCILTASSLGSSYLNAIVENIPDS